MNELLLILAWLTPLAIIPFLPTPAGRDLTAGAALPAILAALLVPVGTSTQIAWVLLGLELSLDATGRLFLLFSGLLWLAAGLYSVLGRVPGRRPLRFRLFFLLAMAGNLLLILAADMLTFYLGYALMGLAAYPLVIHPRSQRARRAGRVYLIWTLIGELAVFCAITLLAVSADSLRFSALIHHAPPAAAVALILLGFGIKLALPGLHVWLPLTYRAAPAVAVAVMSGPMITAGLLGWLRFLPPGTAGLQAWGGLIILMGVIGIVLGVIAGAVQRDPRTVLGYSSIAKMGLIAAVYGTLLRQPEAAAAVTLPLMLFALHHLLVKGALFLGIEEWRRRGTAIWVVAGYLALALSLAGAPLLAGSAAKTALVQALATTGSEMKLILAVSSIGTVGLMARLLWLLKLQGTVSRARFTPASFVWLTLVVAAVWLPLGLEMLTLSGAGLGTLVTGLALAAFAWAAARRFARLPVSIPPGDILHLLPGHIRLPGLKRSAQTLRRLASVPRLRIPPLHIATPALATAGAVWILIFILLLAAVTMPAWTGWR